MQFLGRAPVGEFRSIRFVLTDMDETLTFKGKLAAQTYEALERLQTSGVKIIPVTAAPAGWCDQMARMWPIDGVISENGGLFMRRINAHEIERVYWHGAKNCAEILEKLQEIGQSISKALPAARLADDQPFRLTSLAFARTESDALNEAIFGSMRAAGLNVTVNNLWILGWIGDYDKLSMSRRILQSVYGLDIEKNREAILYSGDSVNDAPMFSFLHHTVGVSTVRDYLGEIPDPPRWITAGAGGAGFVEIADAVLEALRI